MSLERAKDGVLLLSRGGAPECVVPANLKLEKAEGATPSELADQDRLAGADCRRNRSAPRNSIPPLAPGVKIVLVTTLDTELAEFLLAQRYSQRLPAWKSYLGKYPAGPHAGEAKAALAVLYVQDGQTDLAAYQASLKVWSAKLRETAGSEVCVRSGQGQRARVTRKPTRLAKGINAGNQEPQQQRSG